MVRPHRVRGTESDSRAAGCSAGAGARTVPGGQSQEGGGQPARAAPHGEAKKGGVTQPELVLQVPEAGAVLGPFPEKVGLAVLPPLEHLRGGRGPVTPRKLSSRTAVAGLCVRKGKDARVRAAAAQSAALSYAAQSAALSCTASLAAEARGPSLQGRGVRWIRQDCDVEDADSHPAAERGFGGCGAPEQLGDAGVAHKSVHAVPPSAAGSISHPRNRPTSTRPVTAIVLSQAK